MIVRAGGLGRLLAGVVVLTMALLAVGACTPIGATAQPAIHLDNASDEPVGIYVNGGWVGTYQPGAKLAVPLFGHGGPPFHVEVRTIANEVLLDLPIGVEDAKAMASGSMTMGSEASRACGYVGISIGTVAPDIQRGQPGQPQACP